MNSYTIKKLRKRVNMIKNIIFDIGGVLLDYNPKTIFS